MAQVLHTIGCMSDDTKPQDVAGNPQEKVLDEIEGVTIYFNPKGKPPTYWIKDGTKHTDPNRARADARAGAAKRRKAYDTKTVEELYPTPESADEEPPDEHPSVGEGSGEEPPTSTPPRPGGGGPRR